MNLIIKLSSIAGIAFFAAYLTVTLTLCLTEGVDRRNELKRRISQLRRKRAIEECERQGLEDRINAN